MTGWAPSINGTECGCVVYSNDNQKSYTEWKRCVSHAVIEFKELKKIVIDANVEALIESKTVSTKEAESLKTQWYQSHGIAHGL